MSTPGGAAWYTVIRRLMGRPETGLDQPPMTGGDLGTGPAGFDRRVSPVGIAVAAVLGLAMIGLATYLGVVGAVAIAVIVGLVGLALAGAALAGWRQNRA